MCYKKRTLDDNRKRAIWYGFNQLHYSDSVLEENRNKAIRSEDRENVLNQLLTYVNSYEMLVEQDKIKSVTLAFKLSYINKAHVRFLTPRRTMPEITNLNLSLSNAHA